MLLAAALLFCVYAYMVVSAGGREIVETILGLNPRLLALPLLATLLSYLTMSRSYEGIARAAGSVIRPLDMLRITFVANTANYMLPTGGLSGFALRMVMLNKKGVSAGRAVLISFTQTLLTNVMLMVFIVYGLAHLILTGRLDAVGATLVGVVACGLTALLGLCLLMVYRGQVRTRVLERIEDLAGRALRRLGHHEQYADRLRHFFVHIEEGMVFFATRPRAMLAPLAWIFLDWTFTVGVLYAAFLSVGSKVAFGQVVVAFSVSIVVAVLSFVPAGAGVLEVALTGMFQSAGVPREETVLAVLIFRLSFYVVPFLFALVLARGAFAEADAAVASEALR